MPSAVALFKENKNFKELRYEHAKIEGILVDDITKASEFTAEEANKIINDKNFLTYAPIGYSYIPTAKPEKVGLDGKPLPKRSPFISADVQQRLMNNVKAEGLVLQASSKIKMSEDELLHKSWLEVNGKYIYPLSYTLASMPKIVNPGSGYMVGDIVSLGTHIFKIKITDVDEEGKKALIEWLE